MPFKIVQIRENNRSRLFAVPSEWEDQNKLKWPRKHWNKYIRNEFSTPEADWKQMRCSVKRLNIPSHEIAEYVLAEMLNHTDTDDDTNDYLQKISDKTLQELNVNILTDEIIYPARGTAVSDHQNNQPNQHQCCANMEQNLAIQNVLLTNQTLILEQLNTITKVQNTLLQKIASFSVKLGGAAMQSNADRDSQVTEFLEVRNTSSTAAFYFKPVVNTEQLNELENQLSEGNVRQKLKNTFSVICSEGKGIDCAYTLSDVLFSREFLCQCSWSGGSRGNDAKIAWKSYKNILSFFVEMIRCWDITYTMKENELFFKNILKNATKRKMSKNQRASTSRIRAKRSKLQTANDDEFTDEDENTSFYETEQENYQNKVEEKNKDVNEGNTMDIEEKEKNTDKETEAENNSKEKNYINLNDSLKSKNSNKKKELKIQQIDKEQNNSEKTTTGTNEKEREEENEEDKEQHDVDKITKDSKEEINSEENNENTTVETINTDERNEPNTSFNSNSMVEKSNSKKEEKKRHVKIKIKSADSEEC